MQFEILYRFEAVYAPLSVFMCVHFYCVGAGFAVCYTNALSKSVKPPLAAVAATSAM